MHVMKTGIDYISLEWEAPQSDGNSPISQYIVEKAEANEAIYMTAGETNCDMLMFELSQLDNKKQYLVQVFAENAIGKSEPARLPVPVMLPSGEPVICLLYLITLIAIHA